MKKMACRQIINDIESEFPSLPIKYHIPWKDVTTLGVGGEIPILVEPPEDISLVHLLKHCREKSIPVFILGGGSNIAGMDESFEGLVIRLRQNDFVKIKFGREHITAGSGVRLYDLILASANKGFGGLSALSGIPGTLGGALRMNAGAHGVCIGSFVTEICGFNSKGVPWSASKSHLTWSYRSSSVPDDIIITAAIIRPEKVEQESELLKIRAELDSRKKSNPSGRSAGCVFRNPSEEDSAGRLIDISGCKGLTEGSAMVSDVHANYFINKGSASEKDFLELAVKVREKVFSESGVFLMPEVCFVNEESRNKLASGPVKVAVLKGGASSEREVSLISGKAVADSLRKAGYEVMEIDIKSLEITEEMKKADVVFPVLHGGFGEDGRIQKLMEDAGLSFVGCGSRACEHIMDKVVSKRLMDENSILNAPYAVLPAGEKAFPKNLKFPVVVKPPKEGSTFGISLVETTDGWEAALKESFEHDKSEALVEEYIEGTEITVGVVNGKALPVIEIRYPGKMFDYDAKYTHLKGETLYLCPPKSLSDEIQEKARDIAEKFYKAVNARDMVRVDMIVTAKGPIYVLEGNSIPGFTESSLLPKSAKVAGMSFVALCSKLVKTALDRKK